MALSRNKQKVSKAPTRLGIKKPLSSEEIQEYVDICKGRSTSKKAITFYYSIIDNGLPADSPYRSIEATMEKLQSAWWVSEEDIIQEICAVFIQYSALPDCDIFILRYLKNYLVVVERVFSRPPDSLLDDVSEVDIAHEPSYSFLDARVAINASPYLQLDALTPYERYLIYLLFTLDSVSVDLAQLLGYSRMQLCWDIHDLRDKLEELYDFTENTRGHSKGDVNERDR